MCSTVNNKSLGRQFVESFQECMLCVTRKRLLHGYSMLQLCQPMLGSFGVLSVVVSCIFSIFVP